MNTRVCAITGQNFQVSDQHIAFLHKLEELNPYLKSSFPFPRFHPVETIRRITVFGNLSHLYRSKSVLSGKDLLTRFSPSSGYRLVTSDEFWSDQVDNSKFSQNIDFSKSFIAQFVELYSKVLMLPLGVINAENSNYVNGARNVKNCYMCFTTTESQDCLYCHSHYNGNDNLDCVYVSKCQNCYASSDLSNCYECQHCQDCENCSMCFTCLDCRGCQDCIASVGLANQQYCIFNRQYSAADYQQEKAKLNLSSYKARKQLLSDFDDYIIEGCFKINRVVNSSDCSGVYIRNSDNLEHCFNASNSRDSGYMLVIQNSSDCWYSYAVDCEMVYGGANYNVKNSGFCYAMFGADSCWYSHWLFNNCTNCFGCIGLKNKSYCILNKEYSKEEYFELVPRIVNLMKKYGEWGEFMSIDYAPYSYHESWASDYMEGLSDQELLNRGYRIDTYDWNMDASGARPSDQLPDNDFSIEEFIGAKIVCEISNRVFNYQKKELDFYKRMKIPLPRRHWERRLAGIFNKRVKMS